MDYLPVSVQTLYSDLVDRSWASNYMELVQSGGTAYKRTLGGSTYWYITPPTINGVKKKDIYLGPDNDGVRKRISLHKDLQSVRADRVEMVRALQATRLPKPDPISGKILSALAQAGAFRLRAVVVGTAAFQTYSPLLGVRFNATSSQTGDLDIAQFHSISVAVEDEMTEDFLSALKEVDEHFQSVPSALDGRRTLRYALRKGNQEMFSVDVLSPLRGPERRDGVTKLDALRTDAQLLRYLDFLIYHEVNAVSLYGLGIPINVPAPERYAVHKMIVAQLRINTPQSRAKSRKDIRQASELLHVLAEHNPGGLKSVWDEARERGPAWREKLDASLKLIDTSAREALVSL